MRKFLPILGIALILLSIEIKAQICSSPGKDGNAIGLSGIINTYYPGTSNALIGSNSIQVGSPTGASTPINPGDLLLIIQMQGGSINSSNSISYGDGNNGTGYTSIGQSGLYEFITATSSVQGGVITITGNGVGNGLINTYLTSPASGAKGQSSFQIVRVPQYGFAQLTSGLTSSSWNGSTGGILAMDVAGVMDLNSSTINVSGKGFRGGGGLQLNGGTGGSNTDYVQASDAGFDGSKGEGIAGTPKYVYSNILGNESVNASEGYPNGSFGRGAPGNAGGGATDGDPITNSQNAGGGGGSNLGAGGMGGNSWGNNLPVGGLGGSPMNYTNRVFFGGGGGAGSRNNGTGFQGSGGSGGGIIIIRAGSIVGTGSMNSNGLSGVVPSIDGGGGGGAGGSIMISSLKGTNANLSLYANGGQGANSNEGGPDSASSHGPGGGGGGGFILSSDPALSSQVTGGANGTTTSLLLSYGSSPGSPGYIISNAGTNAIVGISSGANCSADLGISLSVNISNPLVGTKVIFTLKALNNGFSTASNAKVIDRLPTGYTYVSDDGAGSYKSGTGIWTLGTLANGAISTLNITAIALGSGNYTDTSAFSSDNYDPSLGNNTATITTNPYSLPVPVADTASTLAGIPLSFNILNNDSTGTYIIAPSSVDLDTLSPGIQSSITINGTGIFSVNSGGKLTFTPSSGFSGLAQTYYTIADQFGNRSVKKAPIQIKVYPVAVRDTISTPANTSISLLVGQNDQGKINLKSASILIGPVHGIASVDNNTGKITYTPNAGYGGLDSLSYKICDLTSPIPLCSSPAYMVIKVKSPFLPIPKADSAFTQAGISINNLSILTNDISGSYPISTIGIDLDTLNTGIQSSITFNGQGTFSVNASGILSFVPVSGFSGYSQTYYSIQDIYGNRSVQKAKIQIQVNPVAVLDTSSTLQNQSISNPVYLNDLGNINPSSVSIVKNPLHGSATVNPSNGNITYTPNTGYLGIDSITYTICDKTFPKSLCSNPGTWKINIKAPSPPIPISDSISLTAINPSIQINIISNDIPGFYPINSGSVDLDTLNSGIQSSINLPGQGSLSVNNSGILTFLPAVGFSGIVQDYYTIADNQGNRSKKNASIRIKVYPTAVRDTGSTQVNTLKSVPVWLNDLGNINASSVKIQQNPLHGTASVNSQTGNISYTPNTGYLGYDSLSYTICDKTKPIPFCSNTAFLVIHIVPNLFTLPIPVPDFGSTVYGKTATLIKITQNDIPGSVPIDSSSVDLDTLQTGIQNSKTIAGIGTFLVDAFGDVRFVPSPGFSGIASDYYRVSDISGNASLKTGLIQVKVYPIANPDQDTTHENSPITFGVLSNDLGNLNPSKINISSGPSHGTLHIDPNSGNITYSPNTGFIGTDNLTYTVCDKTQPNPLCSSPATVTIQVLPLGTSQYLSDLSVQISGPSSTSTGDTLIYQITISNNGPNTGSIINVIDNIPTGLIFVPNSQSLNYGYFYYNSGNYSIQWTGDSLRKGQTGILNFKVINTNTATFTNTVNISSLTKDTVQSNNKASLVTKVIDNVLFFAPKAFTPNGDGKNDLFMIGGIEAYPDNTIQIFNRWGNIVYQSNNYGKNGTNYWDGSGLSDGTYYYILRINMGGKTKVISGYTTLIKHLSR